MIYIDFNGRCGDQFFQYAFARKIQLYLNNNEPMQFNFYNQERWKNKINDNSFKNNLQFFNVVKNDSFVCETTNLERFGSNKQKKMYAKYKLLKRINNKVKIKFFCVHYQKKLQKNGIFYDDEFFEFYKYPKQNVNIFIRGYFENYRNFYGDERLTKCLRHELTPVINTLTDNDSLLEHIKQCNSICVSLRSWKEVNFDSVTFNSRMICGENYYANAIKKICELLPDASFIIFSDDIEWARQIIGDKINARFESGDNSICEKITLMSNCKHFIIANSSFSWWAQYLSSFKDKVVISPNRWYTDNEDKRIINPDWILLEA